MIILLISDIASTQVLSDPNSLPSDLLQHIAKYLYPADVYFLSLSNHEYHNILQRQVLSPFKTSLERILKANDTKFDDASNIVSEFKQLSKSLEPNSVAMSGSIVVQAILGKIWDGSDIDIYCTASMAPKVRAWIVKIGRQVLVNWNVGYERALGIDLANPNIQCVEHYSNMPNENEVFEDMDGTSWTYHKEATLNHGELKFLKNGVYYTIQSYPSTDQLPYEPRIRSVTRSVERNRRPRSRYNIDLIVVAPSSTIQDVIEKFDITICKCVWYGSMLHIQDANPYKAFNQEASLTKTFKNELIKAYLRELGMECGRSFISFQHLNLNDHNWPNHDDDNPGCKGLVFKRELDLFLEGTFGSCIRQLREQVILLTIRNLKKNDGYQVRMHGMRCRSLQYHNRLLSTVLQRVSKYTRRGITFDDAIYSGEYDIARKLPDASEYTSSSDDSSSESGGDTSVVVEI